MNLDELELLAKAATPGPWETERRSSDQLEGQKFNSAGACLVIAPDDCDIHPVADCSCNHTCRMMGEPAANAAFIAAANPKAVLELIRMARMGATAPDLLASLQTMLREHDCLSQFAIKKAWNNDKGDRWPEAAAAARRSIELAKAANVKGIRT